jgi:hypothetical protein
VKDAALGELFTEGRGIRIAVLPFVDPSGGDLSTACAQVISDELIHELVRMDGVRVAAASSVAPLVAKGMDVRSLARKLDGLCRDKAEARRRNHLSYTMIPPDTGCSPLCYCEAPKRIGLTMVSILAAISSAGMRLGVWNQRRAAPKTAQAAVVAGSDASASGAVP